MKRSNVFCTSASAVLLGGVFFSAGVCAQGMPTAASSPAARTPIVAAVDGPVIAAETTAISGKVIALNPAHRLVVIEGDNGRTSTMFAGPNVRNFENLKRGDRIKVRYTEALALALAKGEPGNDSKLGELRTKIEADGARQAAPGGKPGMSATERATLVANVFGIDRQRGILTLRGTDGVPVDIKVADPKALDAIRLNDQIVIAYRQSAVMSIEPG